MMKKNNDLLLEYAGIAMSAIISNIEIIKSLDKRPEYKGIKACDAIAIESFYLAESMIKRMEFLKNDKTS